MVEDAYVRVCWVGRTEGVSVSDKSFCQVGEVRDGVTDVALGDEVFGCSEEDSAELGLPGTAGGGLLKEGKNLLSLPGI